MCVDALALQFHIYVFVLFSKCTKNHDPRFIVFTLMWFSECMSRYVLGELNVEITCIYLQLCFLLIIGHTSRRRKNMDGGFIFVACFKRKIVAGGDF